MQTCPKLQQTMRSCRSHLALSIGLMLLSAMGCGGSDEPPVGTVSGTVTFNGKPVPEGVLYVYNRDTAEAGQGEIQDGKFQLLSELKTGTYVAYVTPIPPPPPNPENPPANLWGAFPDDIPEKYRREDQSDLKIEVKEGHNEVNLEIPSQ